MNSVHVKLDTIKAVKDFVSIMMAQPVEADLITGRYAVDAKSIMGIFSLDLSNTLELVFAPNTIEEEATDCLEAIQQFIV